jgi:hypothetical protein
MPSPLEKIQALTRKALSTESEEEARTAAITALRLAQKHGFEIGSTEPVPPPRPAPPPSEPTRKSETVWFWPGTSGDPFGSSPPSPRPAKPGNPKTRFRRHGKWIAARWESRCRGTCGDDIAVGQRVWWRGDLKGVLCESCYWMEMKL